MLDWYSGLVGYDGGRLRPNMIAEVTPEGEILWTAEKRMVIKGSYSETITLKPAPVTLEMTKSAQRLNLECAPKVMYMSGNPSKFLQGHNVCGPGVGELGGVIQGAIRALPGDVRPSDADSPLWPALHRNRVDTTVMIDLGSHEIVHDWLRHAESFTRSRHGRPLVSGDTVYWGQHSRRWTMKAYCKYCELKAHPPNDERLYRIAREVVRNQLRIELCLRTPELKNRGSLSEAVVWEYMKRIEVGIMKTELIEGMPADLPYRLRLIIKDWMAGSDVRHSLAVRTFYHYRREILNKTGIDIAGTFTEQKHKIDREKFDLAYLRKHQVEAIPGELQGYLFKPAKKSPVWPKS